MINYTSYRKFVTLKTGKRIMFRFLNERDRDELVRMFQEAPDEDTRFLKQDVKDLALVNYWVDHIDYSKVLPLVAVELEDNRLIGDATLHRGKHSAKHIGEMRIFIARPFRYVGLGSMMMEELISWAPKMALQWLRAEIIADHKEVIKACREKGFEVRATLDDYFIRKDGLTHDVVLMLRPVLKREEAKF